MVEGRYRKGSHTVYDNKYHLVWITKYRYRVLSGRVAQRCREVIREICKELDVTIERGHLSMDHVHMLVSVPPYLSISKLVQRLKGKSSRKMQMEFKELKQRYWGKHIWARGYFCATTGAVDEDQVKRYIEGHVEDDETFAVEKT